MKKFIYLISPNKIYLNFYSDLNKVLRYKKGSRLGRFSSFGLLKSTQGQLEVKAALYEDGDQVGAWTIDAWIKGGFTGGDPNTLFQQAANKIMEHLRGNF